MTTILLTGLPRSGTTLVCSLLNDLPDTVALAEPVPFMSSGEDRQGAVREIGAFIETARRSLLERGIGISRHIGGKVPENTVLDLPGETLRGIAAVCGEVRFDKALSRDFTLLIKHPGQFTGLLDELTPRHLMFAVVRQPLAVLASWQTVDMPVQRGHMPMLERFQPRLRDALTREADVLKRQCILMRFFLERYLQLPAGRVLRYEDIVNDPARALSPLSPHSAALRRRLTPVDPLRRYAGVDFDRLRDALRPLRGLIERFYPPENTGGD